MVYCLLQVETQRTDGGDILSGDDVGAAYTGIVADIAKLARQLAKSAEYRDSAGPNTLQAFADHLDSIVASVAVDRSKTASYRRRTRDF